MSKQNRVRASSTRVYVVPVTHPCASCKKPVSERDLCYGCGAHICNACDQTGVEGKHTLDDHRRRS